MAALFYFGRFERRTLASANLSDDKTLAHLERVRSGQRMTRWGAAEFGTKFLLRAFARDVLWRGVAAQYLPTIAE
jgi:hypothetical protein